MRRRRNPYQAVVLTIGHSTRTLPQFLRRARFGYIHMSGLEGLRRERPDPLNMGWHYASFRGFANHMEPLPFHVSHKRLMKSAAGKRVPLRCAEAVPWRCHRSLIADVLRRRGSSLWLRFLRDRTAAHCGDALQGAFCNGANMQWVQRLASPGTCCSADAMGGTPRTPVNHAGEPCSSNAVWKKGKRTSPQERRRR